MRNTKLFVIAALSVSTALAETTHKAKSDDQPVQILREVPLPANSKTALELSQKTLNADVEAKSGKDGRVVLTYGAGTPTIICALLQVTEIDLDPGESIAKDGLDLGDSTDFIVSVRHAGSGPAAYDYLILKPKAPDIETTMTVGTDRRVYYFRLRSTENQFISRVAFTYPEEARAQALQEQALKLAKAQQKATALIDLTPLAAPVKPWKYSTKRKGKDADYLMPVSVGDNGAHTEIQLSQEARVRGLPVLQIRDASGPVPANSHWEENKLIVDALFEDGCLLQGVGRKQQRVCIHNEALKGAKHGH